MVHKNFARKKENKNTVLLNPCEMIEVGFFLFFFSIFDDCVLFITLILVIHHTPFLFLLFSSPHLSPFFTTAHPASSHPFLQSSISFILQSRQKLIAKSHQNNALHPPLDATFRPSHLAFTSETVKRHIMLLYFRKGDRSKSE